MRSRKRLKGDGTIIRTMFLSKWEALVYSAQAEELACVRSPENSCKQRHGRECGHNDERGDKRARARFFLVASISSVREKAISSLRGSMSNKLLETREQRTNYMVANYCRDHPTPARWPTCFLMAWKPRMAFTWFKVSCKMTVVFQWVQEPFTKKLANLYVEKWE